uniref:Ubiquitin-like protease family profile domain-containing protein n=1 Tax=Amphimedon queenslandica TaxID=400682 RepID=A0A1X7UT78_AMPQE
LWMRVPQVATNRSFVLTVAEKVILLGQQYLNDRHIAASQQLLLCQFPNTKGLQNSLLLNKLATKNVKIGHGIQILHDRTNHWIVACNLRRKDNIVEIYDLLYTTSTTKTRSLIGNLFQPLPDKKQVGGWDCGVFAIAMVTAILHGYDPELVQFSQRSMRDHLMKCLEAQSLTPFPHEIL